MVRTGRAAQSAALGRVGGRMPASGLCLQFTRTVFGVAARYPTAISAWDHASHQHTGRPPRGAVVPVYFRTGSPARHVAVALGNGKVVSTNGAKVSLWSSVDQVATLYRGPYIGWSEDLNGVRVYRASGPRTVAVTGCWATATTQALQRRFGTTVDGMISGQTITPANQRVQGIRTGSGGSRLVAAMQRWLRIDDDGMLDAATITALQHRFGTTVDGVVSAPPSRLVTAMQTALNKRASIFPTDDPFPTLTDDPDDPPVPDDLLPDGSTLPVDPDDMDAVLAPDDQGPDADDDDETADDPAADAALADASPIDPEQQAMDDAADGTVQDLDAGDTDDTVDDTGTTTG